MSLFSAMADDSSVWAQGSSLFNISSPLNDLLEKDDFTLEQVLQEDELVQEVKTRNTKLLDFLSQEATVQMLIEYVVQTPEAGCGDLRTLKYPYMACEVICCDIPSITETLVTASNGKVIETLFSFLYQAPPLDPRLAGYFEKIVTMLVVRKPHEMTALLNKHSERLLLGFSQHAASFSIAELLKRLLQPYQADYMDDCMDFPGLAMGFAPSTSWYGGDDDDDDGVREEDTSTASPPMILTWQVEPTVVELLVQTLGNSSLESDAHHHAAEVLVDIIHCGTRAQQTDPVSPTSASAPVSLALVEYLETDAVAAQLVALAVPQPMSHSCLSSMTAAISVLNALLARATNAQYDDSEVVPPLVARAVAQLPSLCALLVADPATDDRVWNQRHQLVPRLGMCRLKLVGLVVLLLQSKYQAVDAAIVDSKVIATCLDLFFQFESVNLLHGEVERMVSSILESGSHALLVALVKDARFLPRLLDAHRQNDAATAVAKGFSLGYMGHLHRMCHLLLTMLDDVRGSTKDEGSLNDMRHADTVLELFEEDTATWRAWDELSRTVLAPRYEQERLPLGGVPIAHASDDPYSVMGFNQHDELLNAQFAEMLGASGFGVEANGFPAEDFEGQDTETFMLPEIMNDSSSSEDEDEAAAAEVDAADNKGEVERQEESGHDTDRWAGTDRWASFEAGGSWAKFETTFEDIPFEPIVGMDTQGLRVDDPVPAIVTTADLVGTRTTSPVQAVDCADVAVTEAATMTENPARTKESVLGESKDLVVQDTTGARDEVPSAVEGEACEEVAACQTHVEG